MHRQQNFYNWKFSTTLTIWSAIHKTRQQTDLLHLSAYCLTRQPVHLCDSTKKSAISFLSICQASVHIIYPKGWFHLLQKNGRWSIRWSPVGIYSLTWSVKHTISHFIMGEIWRKHAEISQQNARYIYGHIKLWVHNESKGIHFWNEGACKIEFIKILIKNVVNREDWQLNVNSEPCMGLAFHKSTMFTLWDVDHEKHKKMYALKSQLKLAPHTSTLYLTQQALSTSMTNQTLKWYYFYTDINFHASIL